MNSLLSYIIVKKTSDLLLSLKYMEFNTEDDMSLPTERDRQCIRKIKCR